MTRIGRNPAFTTPKRILLVSIAVSLPLGGLVSGLSGGTVPVVVGSLVSAAVVAGLIVGIAGAMFGHLDWDEATGEVSFRGRSVPLDSITRAIRIYSAGSNTNAYLSYRFVSSRGPSVRILVAGTPMKGLDDAGLAALARFVAAAPIAEPGDVDGLSVEENTFVDGLSESGGRSAVGRSFLLRELGTVVQAEVPEKPDAERPALSTRELARLERQWRDADADAHAYVRAHPVPAGARRFFVYLTVVAVVVSILALASTIVLEVTGALSDTDLSDALLLVTAGATVLGVLSFLAWCTAADIQVRRLRSRALTWLDARGPHERELGLPVPLLGGWLQPTPGTRIVSAVSGLFASLGALAVIVGLTLLGSPDTLGASTAIAVTGVGIAVLAASIAALIWASRRRREGHRELVRLSGRRMSLPDVQN